MFENDSTINEGMAGGFMYDKRELRVCLFLRKIQTEEYDPTTLMNTVTFMLGVPATSEISGMITVKNPARPATSFKTWKISPVDDKESREQFCTRFWRCWNDVKRQILDLHGENISIIYEGKMLDGNGYN